VQNNRYPVRQADSPGVVPGSFMWWVMPESSSRSSILANVLVPVGYSRLDIPDGMVSTTHPVSAKLSGTDTMALTSGLQNLQGIRSGLRSHEAQVMAWITCVARKLSGWLL